ncbi:hypothetical protein ACMTAS_1509 [Thermotoga neapolitana DSM 4359]|jgi:hypothetical protein|nr:hypothetical protein [Thermotoga neapolitana]KFZ21622.1 hypothetical protein LA10_05779 [Thermotoga neapolitana LA10]
MEHLLLHGRQPRAARNPISFRGLEVSKNHFCSENLLSFSEMHNTGWNRNICPLAMILVGDDYYFFSIDIVDTGSGTEVRIYPEPFLSL